MFGLFPAWTIAWTRRPRFNRQHGNSAFFLYDAGNFCSRRCSLAPISPYRKVVCTPSSSLRGMETLQYGVLRMLLGLSEINRNFLLQLNSCCTSIYYCLCGPSAAVANRLLLTSTRQLIFSVQVSTSIHFKKSTLAFIVMAVLGVRHDSTVLPSTCSRIGCQVAQGHVFGRCWAPLKYSRVTTPRRAGAAEDPETLLTLHASNL